jgi:hypothetical protein
MRYSFTAFCDELIKLAEIDKEALGKVEMPAPSLPPPPAPPPTPDIKPPTEPSVSSKIYKGPTMVSKFAQAAPGFPDPRVAEIAKVQQNPPERKYLNKDVLKQFGKNTLAIGAGTALGEGAATLTNMGLEAAANRYGHKLHPAVPHVTRGVMIPIMGAGSYMAYNAMRQRANEKLEAARQAQAAKEGAE